MSCSPSRLNVIGGASIGRPATGEVSAKLVLVAPPQAVLLQVPGEQLIERRREIRGAILDDRRRQEAAEPLGAGLGHLAKDPAEGGETLVGVVAARGRPLRWW
jgi:hypothetical protein